MLRTPGPRIRQRRSPGAQGVAVPVHGLQTHGHRFAGLGSSVAVVRCPGNHRGSLASGGRQGERGRPRGTVCPLARGRSSSLEDADPVGARFLGEPHPLRVAWHGQRAPRVRLGSPPSIRLLAAAQRTGSAGRLGDRGPPGLCPGSPCPGQSLFFPDRSGIRHVRPG